MVDYASPEAPQASINIGHREGTTELIGAG